MEAEKCNNGCPSMPIPSTFFNKRLTKALNVSKDDILRPIQETQRLKKYCRAVHIYRSDGEESTNHHRSKAGLFLYAEHSCEVHLLWRSQSWGIIRRI